MTTTHPEASSIIQRLSRRFSPRRRAALPQLTNASTQREIVDAIMAMRHQLQEDNRETGNLLGSVVTIQDLLDLGLVFSDGRAYPELVDSYKTIWVPARSMVARTSNGAASGTVEMSTNKLMVSSFDFDAAALEYVQFSVRMPKSWDGGGFAASFSWSHAATTTNFGVCWGVQALAIGNDDALDVPFGTAQFVTDTGGTTNDLYITDETPVVVPAGPAAKRDFVTFQAYRNATDGADTLAIDARLMGITLLFKTDATTDS